MIREFELRLAEVLGTRLPAPLRGAVDVAPGRSNQSRMLLSVRRAEPFEDDLLSMRPEQVPGAPDPRRVLRLRCEVGIDVRALANETRDDLLEGLDTALYLLGAPDLRDGSALLPGDNSDPGFLIRRIRTLRAEPPAVIAVEAEGFFWPVGEAGQSGRAIETVQLRGAFLPVRMTPPDPRIVAGGEALDLRLGFGAAGRMDVREGSVAQAPYGTVVVSAEDAGGRPGAGTLDGGAAGPGGSRVLTVTGGEATLTYRPPATPAVDHLIVALEKNGAAGIELGRFTLRVRSA